MNNQNYLRAEKFFEIPVMISVLKNVVRAPLQPPIDRVKRVRAERSRLFIPVMQLMQRFIQLLMVQSSMYPINTSIRKRYEHNRRDHKRVQLPAVFVQIPIYLRLPALHQQLERRRHRRHHRYGPQTRLDLVLHLVLPFPLEPIGFILSRLFIFPFEQEIIRQRAKREIKQIRHHQKKPPDDEKLPK